MNFNHLHYFHVIAQAGTLSKAAKQLHLSQATLSSQLKALEEYLSVKLFDRASGSIRLNANGRKALAVTEEMFRLGERLDEMFPAHRKASKVRLEIGISTSVSRSFAVERFIQLFRSQRILTRVRQGDHEYLHHELLSSGLDLLITDTLPNKRAERGTETRKLSSPEFVFVASNKTASRLDGELPMLLHGQPFVHYTSPSNCRFEIDQYFRDHRIEPDIVAEADDIYLIREAVIADIGIGVLPRGIIEESKHSRKLQVLGTLKRKFEIHAIYNRRDPSEEILAALEILSASKTR